MKSPRASVALLPILVSCVESLGAAQVKTLLTVWALERRIAALTGRATPKDAHIVLNAFEAREKALRDELEALPKVTGAR